jgi:hypothetical protein
MLEMFHTQFSFRDDCAVSSEVLFSAKPLLNCCGCAKPPPSTNSLLTDSGSPSNPAEHLWDDLRVSHHFNFDRHEKPVSIFTYFPLSQISVHPMCQTKKRLFDRSDT